MRYILFPGWIISRTDGDRHYIDADRLAKLYGLKLGQDCSIIGFDFKSEDDDVHLHPRYDGDYKNYGKD